MQTPPHEDLTISGDVTSRGELHIDGHVQGDVRCASLVLGETSEIKGHVTAEGDRNFRAMSKGRLNSRVSSRQEGKRIHVFWLSGFIFFGSSNGLFERIELAIDAQKDKPVGYVVLDFSAVPGLDTSAILSLIKLRNYCNEHGVTLAFSDLSHAMRISFQRAGFFGRGEPHRLFASRNEALEWCEDMLLTHYEAGEASAESFESWLTAELGGAAEVARIASYFERHELQQGRPMRLRRMVGYTVVGEMGFYRHVPRTATVIAEEPSVVYRLSRDSFDKMRVQDPAAASAFDNLIIRMLSDRLEFADREISALI